MKLPAVVLGGLLTVGSAWAEPGALPALFDVHDIPGGEVLVIHSLPDPESDPLGFIPADGRDVELVARDSSGDWAQVNTPEQAGWVALRFLQSSDPVWHRQEAPENLSCFGTAPHWWLQMTGPDITLSLPEGMEGLFTVAERLAPEATHSANRMILADNLSSRLTISLHESICAEGSSGHRYGLKTNLMLETSGKRAMYAGCCSLLR